MSKKLQKKYLSEDAVKKALKIDSFRNLSKEKIMQFASMIPYVDRDVAIAIINQFPILADFGKTAIDTYRDACNSILENNKNSQDAVIDGYQTILDALSKRMDKTDISDDERRAITEDMITVADKIAEADLQNKKFLLKILQGIGVTVLSVAAVVVAGIGVNSSIAGSEELPELPDDEDSDSGISL